MAPYGNGLSFLCPQLSKKLRGHIGLGLSVGLCVCYDAYGQEQLRDMTLNFDLWNKYEK